MICSDVRTRPMMPAPGISYVLLGGEMWKSLFACQKYISDATVCIEPPSPTVVRGTAY